MKKERSRDFRPSFADKVNKVYNINQISGNIFVTIAKLWHIPRLSNISLALCGYISDRKGKQNCMIFRNFAV